MSCFPYPSSNYTSTSSIDRCDQFFHQENFSPGFDENSFPFELHSSQCGNGFFQGDHLDQRFLQTPDPLSGENQFNIILEGEVQQKHHHHYFDGDHISIDQNSQCLSDSTHNSSLYSKSRTTNSTATPTSTATTFNNHYNHSFPFSDTSSLLLEQTLPTPSTHNNRRSMREGPSNGSEQKEHEVNSNNQTNNSNSTAPEKKQRVKKSISKKKYEPIFDSNQLFIFEENPSEYRIARKRVQNRFSARKVRSVQKNVAENREQTVESLQQTNRVLRETIVDLSAQNARLKDEVSYFRSIFHDTHLPITNQSISTPNHRKPSTGDCYYETLPFTSIQSRHHHGSRKNTNNTQLFLLIVVSCVMAMSLSSMSSDMTFHSNVIMEFQRDFQALQHSNNSTQTHGNATKSTILTTSLELTQQIQKNTTALLRQSQLFEYIKTAAYTFILLLYLVYLAYIIYTNFFTRSSLRMQIPNKQKHN